MAPRRSRSVVNEFDRGLMKRLYGSIILLDLLNKNLAESQSATPESGQVTERDPAEIFRGFVDKIAHICDIKHGGKDVTAAAILQSEGKIEYRLASNGRSNTKFVTVKKFLTDAILKPLADLDEKALSDDARVREFRAVMLRKVVGFNRCRIRCYIRSLVKYVDFCVYNCMKEETAEATSVSRDLKHIQEIAKDAEGHWSTAVEFALRSYDLLEAIAERYKVVDKFLRGRGGGETTAANMNQWGHLCHAIGRLHSYTLAIPVLVEARRRWPELFDDFKVCHVESKPEGCKPIDMKEHQCHGNHILRIINADAEVVDAYNALSPELVRTVDAGVLARVKWSDSDKGCGSREMSPDESSDERNEGGANEVAFYTVVHAELNLLDDIWDQRKTDDVLFFQESTFGKYIGCSKPTCILCEMYFEQHPLQVGRRSSHGNLYFRWRVPKDTTKNLVEGVARHLKERVSRAIIQQAGNRGSRYDSRHTPSNPLASRTSRRSQPLRNNLDAASRVGLVGIDEEGDEEGDEDELEALNDMMDQLAVGSGRAAVPVLVRQPDDESDDDGDGGDGGATL